MLILSRRVGERIVIGNEITVTIIEAARGHARVGISAPDGVEIWRSEIYERIQVEAGAEGTTSEAREARVVAELSA